MLGTTDTHAVSRREELPPISTPRHGTAAVVVNGVIYIPRGGSGYGRPVELNDLCAVEVLSWDLKRAGYGIGLSKKAQSFVFPHPAPHHLKLEIEWISFATTRINHNDFSFQPDLVSSWRVSLAALTLSLGVSLG